MVRHGAVVEAGGEEDADGDEELVCANHGASDPRRRTLSLEHGHKERQGADTETSNLFEQVRNSNSVGELWDLTYPTTHHDLDPFAVGGDLDDETYGDDEVCQGDAVLAAEAVGNGSSTQSTDEGADGEKTDDEARADRTEGVLAVAVCLSKAIQEVWHLQEAGNLAGIIAEAGHRIKLGQIIASSRFVLCICTYRIPPIDTNVARRRDFPVIRGNGE